MIAVDPTETQGGTMDRFWKRLSAVALAAAITVLAACDDDGNDTDAATGDAADPPAATLSEAEFVEAATGICVEHNEKIGAIVGQLFASPEPTPDAMQEALDGIVGLSRQLAVDLGALAEPAELSSRVTAVIDALNQGTDVAASQTGPEFFGTEDDPWAEAAALGDELGLTECSAG
jgi:hypothetical protein